jgi:hypothetical protein
MGTGRPRRDQPLRHRHRLTDGLRSGARACSSGGRNDRNIRPFPRFNARETIVKGAGYIISVFSVMLLGAGAWQQASKQPWTLICLLLGMATSIVGMMLRYASYRREQAEKAGSAPQASTSRPASSRISPSS